MIQRKRVASAVAWLFLAVMSAALVLLLGGSWGWAAWAAAWPAFLALVGVLPVSRPRSARNLTGHPPSRHIIGKGDAE